MATYSDGRRTAVQVVADEAHHLAGRPSPAFATVLDGSRIRAARRLFTTATPLLVAPHLRAANPDVWASMDDPATFGPVAHRLPFGAAISSGPLSDYRLLVLGADEQAAAAVDERVLVDAGIVTDARTFAAALTVLRLARDHGRRRIVTFRPHGLGPDVRGPAADPPQVGATGTARRPGRGRRSPAISPPTSAPPRSPGWPAPGSRASRRCGW